MHTTDAHALEAILRIINDKSQGGSLQARWENALGVSGRKAELVARHAEVVDLLQSVIRHIKALPQAKRSKYEPSIMEWWSVVMAPDVQWGAGNTGALIGLEHINILGSLGDVLESRLELTSASPGGFNIQAVRDQCEEWKATIAETGMPANFRNLLVESLDHLIWLVDNSDKFGYARVARAAEAVTGQLP